jgi:hypothetical protein
MMPHPATWLPINRDRDKIPQEHLPVAHRNLFTLYPISLRDNLVDAGHINLWVGIGGQDFLNHFLSRHSDQIGWALSKTELVAKILICELDSVIFANEQNTVQNIGQYIVEALNGRSEPFFGPLALGHIPDEAINPKGPTFVVTKQSPSCGDMMDTPIRPYSPVLCFIRRAVFNGSGKSSTQLFTIIRVHRIEKLFGCPGKLRSLDTEKATDLVVKNALVFSNVQTPHAHLGGS